MILDDGVLVPDNVLMVETLEDVDLLFDGPDVLLADVYFLHGHEDAVVEVDSLVDLSVGTFPDFFNQLVTLNRLGFR